MPPFRPDRGFGSAYTRPVGVSLIGASVMHSSVVKRSIVIGRHKTSISLEDEFWTSLKEIASVRHTTCSDLVAQIDAQRQSANLSSAIRQFVLQFYQEQVGQGSHARRLS